MNKTVFIYSVTCPLTDVVKYIGKTKDPKQRFRKHCSAKLKSAGSKWIISLKENGLLPVFEIIDEVSIDNWEQMERHYIKLFKAMGAPLLNHTIGGEGGDTMSGRKLTKEQSLKISLSKIGKKNPTTSFYNKANKGMKVNQYDLNGNFINTHLSILDAARSVGRSDRRIQCMVNNKKVNGKNINHVGGFTFKFAG